LFKSRSCRKLVAACSQRRKQEASEWSRAFPDGASAMVNGSFLVLVKIGLTPIQKKFNRFGCVVFLLTICLGCVSQKPAAHNATRSQSFQHVAIGLCEDYPEESRTLSAARRDLEVLATNNLRVLRIAFGWDAMEPEPGKFDWSFWDDFVRLATDEYHIRLIPYVCYTPRWASLSDGEDFWRQPSKDNASFSNFVKQLVGRYKNRIHSWEIWNEPDNPSYWGGTVDQFADLLAAGANAVHDADPNANIVMGGLAWDLNFLEGVLAHPAAMTNVDVINLHNYYETWSSDPLERIPDYVGRAHDILRQHGFDLPIWMAEVGYSSFREGAHVSGQYQAYFANEHTDEAQAQNLFKAMTLLLASGDVSLIAWYRINDLPGAQEVIGDVNNHHLGILDEHGNAKPALRALRFFHSLFGQGFRCIDDQVRVTKPIDSPSEIHAFETPDGKVIVIGWIKNYVPGTRGTNVSGDVRDSRSERLSISFPFPIGNEASVFNEAGKLCEGISVFRIDRDAKIPVLEITNGYVNIFILEHDHQLKGN